MNKKYYVILEIFLTKDSVSIITFNFKISNFVESLNIKYFNIFYFVHISF